MVHGLTRESVSSLNQTRVLRGIEKLNLLNREKLRLGTSRLPLHLPRTQKRPSENTDTFLLISNGAPD